MPSDFRYTCNICKGSSILTPNTNDAIICKCVTTEKHCISSQRALPRRVVRKPQKLTKESRIRSLPFSIKHYKCVPWENIYHNGTYFRVGDIVAYKRNNKYRLARLRGLLINNSFEKAAFIGRISEIGQNKNTILINEKEENILKIWRISSLFAMTNFVLKIMKLM
ncbi:hypothetical protein CEXT_598511 [Caerostris extrusa]|uniref:Uncharacterized protein n=1 Tax=Caerostris extrusa TaxID=172846 RepID=A0AAV4TEZ9_CAEEX|nr:hypothetical protein CEXT_598511 [Caerostris extrusa]